MNISSYVNPKRCFELMSGLLGIYFTYLVSGILHQWMIKLKYQHNQTKVEENFIWPLGFLIFPTGITWIVGEIVNKFQIEAGTETHIPAKKSILCAVTVGISTLTYTYAIYWTNFPVVMMVKSCNLLSVILVGVLCSQVKDKNLKLGNKKIIVGALVTVGIILFKVFDPEGGKKEEKKTELFGIVLLLISLLADGFLPDFQAEIKSVYKPRPMEMMTDINKWVCWISTAVALVFGQLIPMLEFIISHNQFFAHLMAMGVLSTLGQMFVYRMIKQFKQHFVPFVITTRKIVTVGLSLLYFHHETNAGQISGILLVFVVVTYEFVSELMSEKPAEPHHQENEVPVQSNETGLQEDTIQLQNSNKLSKPELMLVDQIEQK